MNAQLSNSISLPWYRQPWLLLLMIMPATAVVGCIITIALALHFPDAVVTDPPITISLSPRENTTSRDEAIRRQIHATLQTNAETWQLYMQGEQLPAELKLWFAHPASQTLDVIAYAKTSDTTGKYILTQATPSAGRWTLIISPPDDSWRIATALNWPVPNVIEIAP